MKGIPLETVKEHSYLGVILHNKMSWKPHVDNICNKANRLIGFLKRNLYHCPPNLKETAYKHIVLPCLGYCTSIRDPYHHNLIHPLEMTQHISLVMLF